MKVNSKVFLESLNAVANTKEDLIFSIRNEAAILSSTDSKAGIQIQSRFEVTNNQEEKTYYLSQGLKDAVSALVSFGDVLDINEGAGYLKINAKGNAKINVSMLEEEPASISIKEPYLAYRLSARQLVMAMDLASQIGEVIYVCIIGDKIEVYGFEKNRVVLSTMNYLQHKVIKEESIGCASIQDTGGMISFAISPDVWKRVGSIFNEEFCDMYLSQGQVRFVCNNCALTLPLYEVELTADKARGMYHKIPKQVGDFKGRVDINDNKQLLNMVNLALLNDDDKKPITFELTGNKLKVSSLAGTSSLDLERETTNEKSRYNGRYIRDFYSKLKTNNGSVIEFNTDAPMRVSTKVEFEYQQQMADDTVEDIKQVVDIAYICFPVRM